MNRTNFLGYPVDDITIDEVLNFAQKAVDNCSKHFIAVQNANKMYLSKKDSKVKSVIENASVILPENAINIGMRLIGKPLRQRNIGGIHIMEELLKLANKNYYSVYFLGATHVNIEKLIRKLENNYPNIHILGYRNGYFGKDEEISIAKTIGKLRPNFLFVGLGSPKQEIFLDNYYKSLNANISIGVGGSFNVIAGLEKPAPKWTKYGFEWLYRAFQDPRKFKRYLIINTYFCFQFIKYILFKKVK